MRPQITLKKTLNVRNEILYDVNMGSFGYIILLFFYEIFLFDFIFYFIYIPWINKSRLLLYYTLLYFLIIIKRENIDAHSILAFVMHTFRFCDSLYF